MTRTATRWHHGDPTAPAGGRHALRVLTALVVFGVAFGFVEAAVVVDLRAHYEPLHRRLFPDRPADDLFPMLRVEQLRAAGPVYMRLMAVELAREAATIAMLAAVALGVARNAREWLAAFAMAFGAWDLAFYGSLKLLLDWPRSLWTWDLLFLLPVPWVGPVLAPGLVAATMVAAGAVVIGREAMGRPVRIGLGGWAAIVGGGLILVAAFCWDFRNTMAGGLPNPFHWPLFALGEGVGLAGFLHALTRGSARPPLRAGADLSPGREPVSSPRSPLGSG
jgi:hypothetical protein